MMKSCAVCIVKDEAESILEWMLYHLFIGFDAIVVYNNNSVDETASLVQWAATQGDVRLVDWPPRAAQAEAYNHAVDSLRGAFDILCMIDADEFLVPVAHDGLRPFLAAIDVPHLAIFWEIFGSSGHIARPAGLVVENYQRKSPKPNRHIKSLIRPAAFPDPSSRFINGHCMDRATYVSASGHTIEWQPERPGKTTATTGTDIIKINHYYAKSREDYAAKLRRGNVSSLNAKIDQFDSHDRNDLLDATIQRKYAHIVQRMKAVIATYGR